MKVAVLGIGYVGLASGVLWAADHEVTVFDVIRAKVDAVNRCECPFSDTAISSRLRELRDLGHAVKAAPNAAGALAGFDMVIVAVPTNYSDELGGFDTRIVESLFLQIASECPDAVVVLRSTVQPGTTEVLAHACGITRAIYNPEFLREGCSFEDCLRPSRVVVGAGSADLANTYSSWLEGVYRANGVEVPPILSCSVEEAESIKLFANAYLATRVAFFNQLDSFALHRGLDASKIIQAVCLDRRIGDHYNNPSFGYGGYCLPKDTKALLGSFGDDVPNCLIKAVVEENAERKADLVDAVLARGWKHVGIYRLVAKAGSDNLRSSAMVDVACELLRRGADVSIYEPLISEDEFMGARIVSSMDKLFDQCDILLANRMTAELEPYKDKVFTRDLYSRD